MGNGKIETYLGFCIRARKIIFGAEMIERQQKGIPLLIVDGSIGKNSLKTILRVCERQGCPLYQTDEGTLAEWVHRPAVKAVAVQDKNLAVAIMKESDGEPRIRLYSGGINSTYGKEI